MATVEALLTAEEYGLLPDNGQPTELVRGRLVHVDKSLPRAHESCVNVVFETKPLGVDWSPMYARIGAYMRAGVRLVCVLDQGTKTAALFGEDGPPRVFTGDQELSLPCAPSASVKVSSFFE